MAAISQSRHKGGFENGRSHFLPTVADAHFINRTEVGLLNKYIYSVSSLLVKLDLSEVTGKKVSSQFLKWNTLAV